MDSALDIKRPPSLYSFWITRGTLEMVVLHALQRQAHFACDAILQKPKAYDVCKDLRCLPSRPDHNTVQVFALELEVKWTCHCNANYCGVPGSPCLSKTGPVLVRIF